MASNSASNTTIPTTTTTGASPTAAVASSAGQAAAGSNSNTPVQQQQHQLLVHHEDLLPRTWRSIAHSIVLVTSKAEKVCAEPTNREVIKEFNDATIGFLRNRLEWGRSISYLEAKLEGKAAEIEALQHHIRCHPAMGRSRKRKRPNDVNTADLSPEKKIDLIEEPVT